MIGPYFELIGAIIKQAVFDLDLPDKPQNRQYIQTAKAFLAEGGGLEIYCKISGMDADYIRQEIIKNGKNI